MPNRNPLLRWIVVNIFLASVTAVPLTYRLRSRPAPPPPGTELRTLTEVAGVLSQAAPELRVVPGAKYGGVETGMYLCNDSRPWEQLVSLTRSDRHAGKWQGVVYCEGERGYLPISESQIHMWGAHAMRIGPFLLSGDPELLRRIDKIIRNHAKREQR